jgi:8-oxo-dGTP diphosphatase
MKIENTAVAVVRDREGKILLEKRGGRVFRGWWCAPGGHARKGETPYKNAQREANEEIGGVKVEKKPFLVFIHDWPADSHIPESHRHRLHAFMAKVTGKLRPGSDAAELGWFTLEEAKKMRITDYTKTVLNHIDKKNEKGRE